MADLINYSELKKEIVQNNNTLNERFNYIEKVIIENNIYKTYGKNIFDAINKHELYLFTSKRIIRVTWDPFILKMFELKDIRNVDLELTNKCENKLRIIFNSGDEIELDNKKDSKEDWKEAYYNYILNIANHLVN